MEAHELHIQLDPAKRASDDIYEQLRALITSGALKPGDKMVLGVRTMFNDALEIHTRR